MGRQKWRWLSFKLAGFFSLDESRLIQTYYLQTIETILLKIQVEGTPPLPPLEKTLIGTGWVGLHPLSSYDLSMDGVFYSRLIFDIYDMESRFLLSSS